MPLSMISPAAGSRIDSDAEFNWTDPCNCTYRLIIHDKADAVLFDSGTQFEVSTVASDLPRGQDVKATLYTMSEGRVFGRSYHYSID